MVRARICLVICWLFTTLDPNGCFARKDIKPYSVISTQYFRKYRGMCPLNDDLLAALETMTYSAYYDCVMKCSQTRACTAAVIKTYDVTKFTCYILEIDLLRVSNQAGCNVFGKATYVRVSSSNMRCHWLLDPLNCPVRLFMG